MEASVFDKVVELARRRGFFWPAYEVYGGVGGFYVMGDLGVKLRDRIVELWKKIFVKKHGFYVVDTPTIGPYVVFKASGHVDNFKDPMAECLACGRKFRADHLLADSGIKVSEGASTEQLEALLNENEIRCPECGASKWRVRLFLTMFETKIGPYAENKGFLRPETAQGIFVEFKRIYEISRKKLPLGIAQIGRGYRNEISPRQAIVRLREFNMLELEFFMDPEGECPYMAEEIMQKRLPIIPEEKAEKKELVPELLTIEEALKKGYIKNECLAYFMELSTEFLELLGVPRDKQRFHGKPKEERAHYSLQTFDHEVYMPGLGWVEVAGLAYRTDYDLKAHQQASKKDMSVSVQLEKPVYKKVFRWRITDMEQLKRKTGDDWKKIISIVREHEKDEKLPELLEKLGYRVEDLPLVPEEKTEKINVRRFIPHVVEPSYGLERLLLTTLLWSYKTKDNRTVLSIPPYLSPVQVAVFPLVTRDGLPEKARELAEKLSENFEVIYDDSGSIGRRYARVDEIGVPYSITIDYQTLADNTVTIRFRDTWEQIRVNIDELPDKLRELLSINGKNR